MNRSQEVRHKIGDNKLLHVVIFVTAMFSISLHGSIARLSEINVLDNRQIVMSKHIEPVAQHTVIRKKRPPRRLRSKYMEQSFERLLRLRIGQEKPHEKRI